MRPEGSIISYHLKSMDGAADGELKMWALANKVKRRCKYVKVEAICLFLGSFCLTLFSFSLWRAVGMVGESGCQT